MGRTRSINKVKKGVDEREMIAKIEKESKLVELLSDYEI